MKTLLPLVYAVALLTGCATNPFGQFYQSYTNGMPVAVQQRLLPSGPQPQIFSAAPQNHKDESLDQTILVLIIGIPILAIAIIASFLTRKRK